MPGRFVTVEGLEGAGKTTCLEYVRNWLRQRGIEPVMTREPGGTALGEDIRNLLLSHRHDGMSAEAETLLVFAARAEHLAKVIRPALEAGSWVVCDRFTDATYAYQGGGRRLGAERIATLEQWAQGELRPDLTLFLDVSIDQGLERAAQRGELDRFESEKRDFFHCTRNAYLSLCEDEPERIKRLDASQSIEGVQVALDRVLEEFMNGKGA